MNPSETPRTDTAMRGDSSVGMLPEIQTWDEAVEFARVLERDLNTMTRERDGYRMSYDNAADSCRAFKHRADELRTMLREVADHGDCACYQDDDCPFVRARRMANAHPHGRAPARTVQGVVGSLDSEDKA